MKSEEEVDQRVIALEELKTAFPHIPADCGGMHAQAALVCLDHNRHSSGVKLTVEGDFAEAVEIRWQLVLDDAMRAYWKDLTDATNQGAVGIAILLVRLLFGYTVVERSSIGTGIDWWLGTEGDELFQKKARLEVSGLLQEPQWRANARLKEKKEQTKQSDRTRTPASIIVVEFSAPQALVGHR
jgi:hypothetical protein